MTYAMPALRFAVGFAFTALAVLGFAAPAQAHGEQTQEAFLRASTVLLYDVKFSRTTMDVGDELVVTGRLRVMDAWPEHTIAEPEIGFLSLVTPGPVFAIKDRELSGTFTPQSVEISKGSRYSFSVTAVAREAGRWHVHPSVAVHGTGTLAGRGEWITVGPGHFTNTVKLASGRQVNLTTYGFDRVVSWHLIAFATGLSWLIYWLRRPKACSRWWSGSRIPRPCQSR
jgi:methane/ammonia monooxygenase subunit B